MIQGITYILNNNAGFKAVIGQNKALTKWKIYPVVAPQAEQGPYSVVRQFSKLPQQCKQGAPTNFDTRFSVTSWALNYEDAVAIDNAVIAALSEYGGISNSIGIDQVRLEDSADGDFDVDRLLFSRVSVFSARIYET